MKSKILALFLLLFPVLLFGNNNKTNVNIDFSKPLRCIHIGGNWGRNKIGFQTHPQDFFEFLHKLNVNTIGIVVTIYVDDTMDSTVERKYRIDPPWGGTFPDDILINTIRAFKNEGFYVYLNVDVNGDHTVITEHPVKGWQLGDPFLPTERPDILPEYWPWGLDHPLHTQFVKKFFETYTEQLVYYGKIAEAEGIEILSLGAESERLFRTRAFGERWPNHFKTELTALVDSVRNVYSGLITYELYVDIMIHEDFYGSSYKYLWGDLGLDVIGLSAYFPLTDTVPTSILSVDSLETSWGKIFDDYLSPLKSMYTNKPMMFLEFGYVDDITSPYEYNVNEHAPKIFIDIDNNGLDDGEETQANIYKSFFNVNIRNQNIVKGIMLWGHHFSSDEDWQETFGKMRTLAIRNKLAEDIVRDYYKSLTFVNAQYILIPTEFTISQNFPNPFNSVTTINFQVPEYSHVKITIFDIIGRKIITLFDEKIAAGFHNIDWDGRNTYGKIVSSGLYLYLIESKNYTEVKKALLLK